MREASSTGLYSLVEDNPYVFFFIMLSPLLMKPCTVPTYTKVAPTSERSLLPCLTT